ncbi:MAG: hypothetical protein KF688_07320 [Pirellulales bacterium]|nr:hypothetical protein [Pirellulales bacterium]MBX3434583.1 hypothetical protein [Pirellulales bacterium]
MSKYALCVAVCLSVASSTAWGQHCHNSYGHTFHSSYLENAMWPSQYVQQPRQTICDTFAAMRNSGWRRQNMLGEYHFNEAGTELSQAGRTKVQWIATQAHPHRRQVFVAQGADPQSTAARVANVQEFVSRGYPMAGEPIVVHETSLQYESRPAGMVDATMVGYQANRPAPMLPAASGSASGSTGE